MSKPKNKIEIRRQFYHNTELVEWCKDLVQDERFQEYLEVVHTYSDPYTPENSLNPIPHIQSQIDGGIKAVSKIFHCIQKIPFFEFNEKEDSPFEYVGYRRQKRR